MSSEGFSTVAGDGGSTSMKARDIPGSPAVISLGITQKLPGPCASWCGVWRVLPGEQLEVGVVAHGLEHLVEGPGPAVGLEDHGRAVSLRAYYRRRWCPAERLVRLVRPMKTWLMLV